MPMRLKRKLEKLVTNPKEDERIMVGVTLKDRKSTNWIWKQSGVTDVIRNIRESKQRWGGGGVTWRGDVTKDGQSESQNEYPVDIKDLKANQVQNGATI